MIALAGIFVGGRSTRMGGTPKGLMPGPSGEPLVARWVGVLGELGLGVVLVGEASAYGELALQALADDPPGIGPLGGLVALLRHAATRPVLAFACDMPFVTRELVERLLDAHHEASIVAPRNDGRWEPLFARYDPVRVLPLAVARAASPFHSLQRLLDEAGATTLALLPHEVRQLRDWDSPDDVRDVKGS